MAKVEVDTGKAAIWSAVRAGVTRLYALQDGAWWECGVAGWMPAHNPIAGPRALDTRVWDIKQITRGAGVGVELADVRYDDGTRVEPGIREDVLNRLKGLVG